MTEPDNLVLKLLREMREDMSTKKDISDVKADVDSLRRDLTNKIADVRSEVKSLRADVASDLISVEKRLGDRISHLNRAVIEYHSTAVGHGLLYTEIDERLRRVEEQLKLPPIGSN
jgi:chromosome segregation ATPase